MRSDPWTAPRDISGLPKTSPFNFTSYSLPHSSYDLVLAGMFHLIQAEFTR